MVAVGEMSFEAIGVIVPHGPVEEQYSNLYAHLADFATVKSWTLLIHPTSRDIFVGFYPRGVRIASYKKNYDGMRLQCDPSLIAA